jgi:dynein heavy chain
LLSILSNEIVRISKDVVGNEILNDPNKSYTRLKDAVKLCAMFRGTYIDFKEKADVFNKKYYTAEKKYVNMMRLMAKYWQFINNFLLFTLMRIDFNDKLLWWMHDYNLERAENPDKNSYDEFEVMRQNSPWPQRNHSCFHYLNSFMER